MSAEREVATNNVITAIRGWLLRNGAEFMELPETPRNSRRVPVPSEDRVTTMFAVDHKSEGSTVIVVPSLSSPDRDTYLRKQRRLGRRIQIWE